MYKIHHWHFSYSQWIRRLKPHCEFWSENKLHRGLRDGTAETEETRDQKPGPSRCKPPSLFESVDYEDSSIYLPRGVRIEITKAKLCGDPVNLRCVTSHLVTLVSLVAEESWYSGTASVCEKKLSLECPCDYKPGCLLARYNRSVSRSPTSAYASESNLWETSPSRSSIGRISRAPRRHENRITSRARVLGEDVRMIATPRKTFNGSLWVLPFFPAKLLCGRVLPFLGLRDATLLSSASTATRIFTSHCPLVIPLIHNSTF